MQSLLLFRSVSHLKFPDDDDDDNNDNVNHIRLHMTHTQNQILCTRRAPVVTTCVLLTGGSQLYKQRNCQFLHFVLRTYFKSRLAAAELIALVVMMSVDSYKSDVLQLTHSLHCIPFNINCFT